MRIVGSREIGMRDNPRGQRVRRSTIGLLHADLVALGNLTLQLLPSNFTALSEGYIERFRTNNLVVHPCYGVGGLLGTDVTNETEALGVILIVTHDFGTSDGSESFKLCAEFFVVNVVVEILDIEVARLKLLDLVIQDLFVRLLQTFLAFTLLLCPTDVELAVVVIWIVEGIQRFGGIVMVLEVDESNASALSLGIKLKDGGGDRPVLGEHLPQSFLGECRV